MNRAQKIELVELLEEKNRRRKQKGTVVGLVDPEKGLSHAICNHSGQWETSQLSPDVYIPVKLEKAITSTKRFIILIGGRDSGKSVSAADICLIDAKDNNTKTYCLREFQSSIESSVYSLIKDEIERLDFDEFNVLNTSIAYKEKDAFKFAGLARNTQSIKSAHGFRRFLIEEAQFISEESLETLTPTARNKPKKGLPVSLGGKIEETENNLESVSMMFIANPGSSEDPFSKRFIAPFQDHLDREGIYEDDLHLIIVMNYDDNPWYMDSGMELERKRAYKELPRALYDHVWLGKYNDSVENSLIIAEWFDACVDAHIKLGFEPRGAKIAAHDPSDTGPDSKGYAMRHGCVVMDVQEMLTGNVNEGGHWAAGIANQQGVDYFSWDGDGMGVALNEQISKDFYQKRTELMMFRGSEGPDNPEAIYKPAKSSPIIGQKKVKDTFRNKRAQYYTELVDRVYRTYRAVDHGEYHDPETLISFSSEMALLSKLRAELCRMPIKPNGSGLIDLYTKQEMMNKFKFPSPNLADSVMMLMRLVIANNTQTYIPKPIRVMGRR